MDYERFRDHGFVPRWADPEVLRPPFQLETIAPPYHPKVLEEQDRRSLYGVPHGESVVDPRFGPVESEEAFLLRRFGARGPPAGEVTRSSVALLCAHRLDKWAAVLANPPSRGSPPATPALDAWSKLMPPDQDLVDRPQARPLGDARPPSVPCVAPATFGPFSHRVWNLWPELPPDLPTVLPVHPASVDRPTAPDCSRSTHLGRRAEIGSLKPVFARVRRYTSKLRPGYCADIDAPCYFDPDDTDREIARRDGQLDTSSEMTAGWFRDLPASAYDRRAPSPGAPPKRGNFSQDQIGLGKFKLERAAWYLARTGEALEGTATAQCDTFHSASRDYRVDNRSNSRPGGRRAGPPPPAPRLPPEPSCEYK